MSGKAPGAGLSVLIVEDENVVALDIRFRLEGYGYVVCGVVATGDLAVSEALSRVPDLVLMDIQLKGPMDGIRAAELIRAESDIPIVFVTAFTDDDTLKRVMATGAYGYVVKPYHERELKITIELAVSKHRYELELRDAKEAAEAGHEAKTRFLSNVSHELKTPLNVIIGFLDLAKSGASEQELEEFIFMAYRGARKLECIVDSILDYTRLELGDLVPRKGEFELDAFLRACWEPFAYEAADKGLAARLYVDPDLPATIVGDEEKLGTLIRNLVENAVKFTDSGHVLLSAEMAPGADGGHGLLIRVIDTGTGIPEEKRRELYEAFTQGDDSLTRAAGGIGLGLSLAKALAKLLSCELDYAEVPGGGSEFILSFGIPADAVPA
ncbi:MAG: response regulator, partial [Spirochaetes bacterium]|nr:response regulator [Spirochaetota bacterium]